MAGYRDKVIHSLSGVVSLIPPRLLQQLTGQRLLLPVYHTISDGEMPHIRNLYTVKGVKAFTNDLDFLLKYYSPIGYQEFRELKENGRKPQKPSFLLSFDDGLKEFHDVIAPILLQKGIPAICFLNSDFIDSKALFFRYKASLLIDELKKNPQLAKSITDLFDDSENLSQALLSIRYRQRELLDEVASRLNYDFDVFLKEQAPYLTTEQVNTLINQGFHFGAHSIDHPEYQYISLDEQLRQTTESVESVCDKFNLDYRIFAFPFTDHNVSKEFFTRLKKQKTTDFTFGCAGQKEDEVSTNFQRIPFEMEHLSGRQIHNAELLYYLLKMPFGKNELRRE